MPYRLGVDLGTTYTAAATLTGDTVDLVPLGNRALQVPSVLFLPPDGEMLVGEAAERRALTNPTLVVREFKRRIGDPVPMLVGGAPHSPQSLAGRLLRWVVDRTQERAGEPPESITVTHPANWGPFKLDLLGQTIRLADLENVSTCIEPEAAAIAFAHRSPLAVGERVAVYDLGGGTFDAAVLARTASGFDLVGRPEGIEHLGGVDFDAAVLRHVVDCLDTAVDLTSSEPTMLAAVARLARDCVDAKEALSADTEVTVPVTLPGVSTTVRLTRAEFEEMARPALEETVGALRRALRSADTEPDQLTTIVLVGGSSRIPLVSGLLSGAFGRPLALGTHPKHDVAIGAALRGSALAAASAPTAAIPVVPAPAPAPAPQPSAAAADASTEPVDVVTASAHPDAPADPPPHPQPPLPVTPAVPPALLPVGRPGTQDDGAAPVTPSAGPGRGRLAALAAVAVAVVVAGTLLVVQPWRSGAGSASGSGSTATTTPTTSPAATTTATGSPSPTAPALPRSQIPLAADVGVGVRTLPDRTEELVTVSITTGEVKRLKATDRRQDFRPVISQDRRTIVYLDSESDNHTNARLRVVAADGTNPGPLLPGPIQGCSAFARPAWHSTTNRFILTCQEAEGRRSLHLFTLGDPAPPRLLDIGFLTEPAFLPDGSRIVYWKSPIASDGGSIYVLDVTTPGAKPRQLTTSKTDNDPAVSPDGKTVVFRRDDGGSEGKNLYSVPITDGPALPPETRLTSGGQLDESPTWDPDGSRILFTCGSARARSLCLVNPDGRGRRVVPRASGLQTVVWSPF